MGAKLSACLRGPSRSHEPNHDAQLQLEGSPFAPACVPEALNTLPTEGVSADTEPANTCSALMLPTSPSAVGIYRKITGAVKMAAGRGLTAHAAPASKQAHICVLRWLAGRRTGADRGQTSCATQRNCQNIWPSLAHAGDARGRYLRIRVIGAAPRGRLHCAIPTGLDTDADRTGAHLGQCQ